MAGWDGLNRRQVLRGFGAGAMAAALGSAGLRPGRVGAQVRPVGAKEGGLFVPEIHVEVYEPKGAPEPETMVDRTSAPRMTAGRAALLGLIRRYLAGLMDASVSLLEIHKLMYFLQEAGEPLRLKYEKAIYGPYAKNLRHVLNRIEGHFITGYGDAQDAPEKQIELRPDASRQAEDFLRAHEETRSRLNRVGSLIEGFETPYGMELLSTVHWVATRENARSAEEALAQTYDWADRKRMFKPEHIHIAWEVLANKDWLPR